MSEKSNQDKISIIGQEYTQKAPADETNIRKIAILAGMNITDELFTAKQSGESDSSDAEEKISSLIELIDESL